MVGSGMKYYWPLFTVMILGILINLYFSHNVEPRSLGVQLLQLVLILPAILYMLYYLTLGRKNYLVIETDKDNVFAS
jgi:bacteriorhodopsin